MMAGKIAGVSARRVLILVAFGIQVCGCGASPYIDEMPPAGEAPSMPESDAIGQVQQAITTANWTTTGNNGAGGAGVAKLGLINTTPSAGPWSLEFWVKPSGVTATRALRIETTSGTPNIVGGNSANSVVAGSYTATISGGGETLGPNKVTDHYGTIGGGAFNTAGNNDPDPVNAQGATISGGSNHLASAAWSTVGGGYSNTTPGGFSTVGGGSSNTASGGVSVVGGGGANIASNTGSFVGGGETNTASGQDASVGGGQLNVSSGLLSTVAGGGSNQAKSAGSAIGGGGDNVAGASSGGFEVVAGGAANQATGAKSAIGGGLTNTASGDYSAVAGGTNNNAGEIFAAIGGGSGNSASGGASIVAGGQANTASGDGSTVPGGFANTASGGYSLAAGQRANANFDGCFVWADNSTTTTLNCAAANRFVARAAGGIKMWTNSAATLGAELAPNATQWTQLSDRNAKRDIVPLNTGEILRRFAAMPLYAWAYKDDPSREQHMGPMAQDFHAVFGLGGDDDKRIGTLDADGVMFAAIQGLHANTKKLESDGAALADQVKKLAAENRNLQRRLERLEGGIPITPAGTPPGGPYGAILMGLGLAGAFVAGRRRRVA